MRIKFDAHYCRHFVTKMHQIAKLHLQFKEIPGSALGVSIHGLQPLDVSTGTSL